MAECTLAADPVRREPITTRHEPTLKAEYCRGYHEGYQDGEATAVLAVLAVLGETDAKRIVERHFGLDEPDDAEEL